MYNIRLIISTLLLCSLLFSIRQGSAADDSSWYDVEVIIFNRHTQGAGSTEHHAENPGSPAIQEARVLAAARDQALANSAPVSYERLVDTPKLAALLHQLQKTKGQIEPLVHLAWRQPGETPENASAVNVSSDRMLTVADSTLGRTQVPNLEGTIRVGAKRYLHVVVDLLYRRLGLAANSEHQRAFGPTYQQYRMQARRRMRSGEVHYIDHPNLGVLITVNRFEPPQPLAPVAPVAPAEQSIQASDSPSSSQPTP